ncbi:UbiA prenyltransferase family protein [Portibacter marinus]|uniref:hypothetical protein n=1 Tax=Portibacter marinus TaxID=2898660 RepID=UPI001F23A812|nr:hypothetical protein [Portibacter marinus]
MKALRKLVDFYIYSSIHIALGATLSVLLCYAVLTHIPDSDYPLFVFSSTMFLYGIHRIVGIKKVEKFDKEGRFAVIKKFRVHLILYALFGGIASIYFFSSLPTQIQLLLIIPGGIAMLYVLPLFTGQKRLRDFDFIKIYLIVVNWALIIGLIPYVEVVGFLDGNGVLYTVEKACFIFAITVPFDIRDIKVDEHNGVSTIPRKIGVRKSYHLSYILIMLAILMVACLSYQGLYSGLVGLGLIAGYLITIACTKWTKGKSDDYFFSGLLDGTIALVALIGIVLSGILQVLL